jgi:hypothetical protein
MLARSLCLLVPSVALSACTAPQAAAPATPLLALEPTETTADRPEAAREPSATYAELVRDAAAREGDNAASCLFERTLHGLRMVGFSTAALRPLPPPEPDLDAALSKNITLNVLTPFGRYGSATAALTLASFTYAPPTREAIALVVTDQGIALRGTSANVPMRDKLTLADAVEAAHALLPATVFVSAEASVPTGTLADLLSALQEQRVPTALAVNLAPSTRLPEAPSAPVADTCPNGLPDTSDPEGALDVGALAPGLSELRTHAADCLSSADPRGAAGGRLNLLLRVSSTGALANACIDKDEIGDARLRACILDKAQKLHFPKPTPSGSVDLSLPLSLVPGHAPVSPLLCPAAP